MSCRAKRDPNGTWHIQYRWTDWTGTKKKSQKRGFKTKKEAEEWYAHFILQQTSDPTMTLNDFWEIYKADMEKRLRKTTMKQKEYVMKDKVLPYFGNTPINAITAPMIRKWQGEMIDKGFKPTYLKTINNQLSSILNYAVRFYELRSNPCHKAGSMGKSKADERPYWTLEEFQKFSDAIMDKRDSWMAFQILFWTGMRIGELLALQVKDVNFEDGTIRVDESLTNMIIHADYLMDAGVLKVIKRSDSFEFTNPGILKLPLEDIYRGGNSKSRNPHMQTMLRLVGLDMLKMYLLFLEHHLKDI